MSKEKTIIKREVRFSVYVPGNKQNNDDYHYIKEQVTYDDNTQEPRTYLVKNFQRPIWITKPQYRNYQEKKEFEDIDKTDEIKTTETLKNITIAKYLQRLDLSNNQQALLKSPYIYGYDITSTSFIKFLNLKKNNFIQSAYTVAVFDIEVDIDSGEIILATIARKVNSKFDIRTCMLSSYVKGPNFEGIVRDKFKYYLPKYTDSNIVITKHKTEVDLLKEIFKVANDWAPDFLSIWNMNYDIPYILDRLKLYNIDPRHIICDTSIPFEYRYLKYVQGSTKKVTSSGVVKPKAPSDQWHTLYSTSKFYVIDAMCTYRQLRINDPEKSSYSLDYILRIENISDGKLNFDEAKDYVGVNWHKFMSKNYPHEYVIYNIYDCLGVIELEDKFKDLTYSLPSFAGITDFNFFNRNPKKIVDALFIYALQYNKVIGTVSIEKKNNEHSNEDQNNEEEDNDEEDVNNYDTLSLKGWIVSLKQNYIINDGLKCFSDLPNLKTNMRGLTYDVDVISAYPNATIADNVSKETTYRELIDIEGVEEEVYRMQNLGLMAGAANSLEYCTSMFNLPTVSEIEKYL